MSSTNTGFWNQDPNVLSSKNPIEFHSDNFNITIPLKELTEINILDWLWRLDLDGFHTTDIGLGLDEKTGKPIKSFNEYDLLVNRQKKATSSSEPLGNSILQYEPLIYQLKTSKLESSIQYKLFELLMKSYNPAVNERETLTKDKLTLISIFLDSIMQTEVMKLAFIYIKNRLGYKYFNYQRFKGTLFYIWFALHTLVVVDPTTKPPRSRPGSASSPQLNPNATPPTTSTSTSTPNNNNSPRSSSSNDKFAGERKHIAKVHYSSAFEHIFVGEIQLNKQSPNANNSNSTNLLSTTSINKNNDTPTQLSASSSSFGPLVKNEQNDSSTTTSSEQQTLTSISLEVPNPTAINTTNPFSSSSSIITPSTLSQPSGLFSPTPTFNVHDLKMADELLSNEALVPNLFSDTLGDTYLSQNQYVQGFLSDLSYTFLDSDSSDESDCDCDECDSDCDSDDNNNNNDGGFPFIGNINQNGLISNTTSTILTTNNNNNTTTTINPPHIDSLDLPPIPLPTINITHNTNDKQSSTHSHHQSRSLHTPSMTPINTPIRSMSRSRSKRRSSITKSPAIMSEHPNDVGVNLLDDFKLYVQDEEKKLLEEKEKQENDTNGNNNNQEQQQQPIIELDAAAKRELRRQAKKQELANKLPTPQERYLKRMTKIQSKYNQHVLSKAQANGVVLGLHFWYSYYLLERTQAIQYLGHKFNKNSLAKLDAPFSSLRFIWTIGNKTFLKDRGSMMVGCSPAFLFAFSTVCFFEVQSVTDATHYNAHRYDLDYEYDNTTQMNINRKNYHQNLQNIKYRTSSRVPYNNSNTNNVYTFSTPNTNNNSKNDNNSMKDNDDDNDIGIEPEPLVIEPPQPEIIITTTTSNNIQSSPQSTKSSRKSSRQGSSSPLLYTPSGRHNPITGSEILTQSIPTITIGYDPSQHRSPSSNQQAQSQVANIPPPDLQQNDCCDDDNDKCNDNKQASPQPLTTSSRHGSRPSSRQNSPQPSSRRNSHNNKNNTNNSNLDNNSNNDTPSLNKHNQHKRRNSRDFLVSSDDEDNNSNNKKSNHQVDSDDEQNNANQHHNRGRNKTVFDPKSPDSRSNSYNKRSASKNNTYNNNTNNYTQNSPHHRSNNHSPNRRINNMDNLNGNERKAQQKQFENELQFHIGNAQAQRLEDNGLQPNGQPQIYDRDSNAGGTQERSQIGLGWATLPAVCSNFITRRVIDGFVYEIIVCKENDFLVSVYNNLVAKHDESKNQLK